MRALHAYMAPTQYQPRHSFVFLFIIFLHIAMSYSASASSSSEDANALLKFKETLKDDSGALSNWNSSVPPCFGNHNNWVGLVCSRAGNIWGLRLENMGLSGSINIESIQELARLRSISFMHNSFSGQLPDFSKLKSLKGLFLSHNNFEGSIPPNAFEGMRRLRKIYLSFNKFSGEIPNSLIQLGKLVELSLDNNQFQGVIPDFKAAGSLKFFNVSNNQLNGSVPNSLSKFAVDGFSGNKGLCGPPLANACAPSSGQISPASAPNSEAPVAVNAVPQPASRAQEPSDKLPISAIVIGVVMAVVLAILLVIMVLRNSQRDKNDDDDDNNNNNNSSNLPRKTPKEKGRDSNEMNSKGTGSGADSSGHGVGGGGRSTKSNCSEPGGKLTFVRDDRERFDLADLLKAAAEVLGSGPFGSSYKATLNNGSAVVVKRFKQMNNVGREEFQEHMRRLGRLSHPNLLPLVAYYYRKEEKLFISDPVHKGGLALLLHGQGQGQANAMLDWATRLKVIKGVARGLSYLYKELPSMVAPHGHLKSSNVLLDGNNQPLLCDYALIPLINQESVQETMIAYKSPEYFNTSRITKKTDVWSLGILIIELITGKFPAPYLQEGRSEVDMTVWVKSVVNQGIDNTMGLTINCQGEMQKLLEIGLACSETSVDKRIDIKQACERIEEVRERDNDDDFYSTTASTEPDLRSSRTSDDFTAVSIIS